MHRLSPYQELFFRQEIALGTASNHLLRGRAIFYPSVQAHLLQASVEKLLLQSEWPYLQIDVKTASWVQSETLNGEWCINRSPENKIGIQGQLWSVVLTHQASSLTLDVTMHHVLADAHSFQLFWQQLQSIYFAKEEVTPTLWYNESSFSKTAFPGIKTVEQTGLGKIKREKINITADEKSLWEQQCKTRNIQLSTLFLAILQHLADHCESMLGITLQTGMALRNRPLKTDKHTFTTAVNFLPVQHFPLAEIKQLELAIKQVFRYQNYPLLHWLQDHQQTSAFNILFSYQKESFYDRQQNTSFAEVEFLPTQVDENIMGVHVLDYGNGGMEIQMDCRIDFADAVFWKSFLQNYTRAIQSYLANGCIDIYFPLSVASPQETNTIPLFEAFDQANDDRLALITGKEKFTFKQLRTFVRDYPLQDTKVQFISPDRSSQSIIHILAAWKKGKMVSFASPFDIADLPKGDFLYICQTSGSTGIPKRICLHQKGIESLFLSWKKSLSISQDAVHLSLADQRFDVFFGDLFRSLFLGSTLVLATEEERLSPVSVEKLCNEYNITHLESTPSFLQLLAPRINHFHSLRVLICGSESISTSFYRTIFQHKSAELKILNSYGLTEVCIDSAIAPMKEAEDGLFPVGWPLGDQYFEIVDRQRKVVPIGVWGELSIAGHCVGTPIKPSEEKYTSKASTLVYFTGDRAMIHPEHGLVVRGRIEDDFIKVNGRRIPAKEIEYVLSQEFNANHACVLEKEGLSVLLYDANKETREIKEGLLKRFSKYQLPDCIFLHKDWPRNQNGKLDKEKIKSSLTLTSVHAQQWEPSDTPFEKTLSLFLHKTNKRYGDKDAELPLYGWSSIDLLSLCNQLATEGYAINISLLLQHPTIATLIQQGNLLQTRGSLVEDEPEQEEATFDAILSILNKESKDH
jgi:acyl-coenzyme A synthetase/AMP-(fatty) acid ligase